MNDPDHKTIPKVPPAAGKPAEPSSPQPPAPANALHPDEEAWMKGNAGDDAATIRIARKLPTERLPRVILAQAQQRRRRGAVIVVGFLAGFLGFAGVWSQRDADRVIASSPAASALPPAMTAIRPAPVAAPIPSVAAPAASETPPPAALSVPPTAPPPVASTAPRRPQPPPPSTRPTRERSVASREPPASKSTASATSASKPAIPSPSGGDLLDFEGPAPK